MSLSGWLVACSIFLIILSLALGIGLWFRNHSHPTPHPPSPYQSPLVWGPPVPGPNSSKNYCQLYQFPTSILPINSVPTVFPGTPSFNPNTLNILHGSPVNRSCIDSDQILAQQVQHSCVQPNGTDNTISRCFLINGGTTGIGGSESYYTNSGCLNIPPCVGELSLVSINYQSPTVTGTYCLQSNGTGSNISISLCNPSNPSQLFRITRTNPGQNPNTIPPGQGQNGLLAQILDRNTNLCVVSGTGTTNIIFDPNYIHPIDFGCSGPSSSFTGTNLVLGPCTGGLYPGYVWALLPSISYCPLIGGCPGCIGCPGCKKVVGSSSCSGCIGCTGNSPLITPPQITYVGNIDIANIPSGPSGYHGLTGPSAIFSWFIDNNAKAMYFGGTGTGVGLLPIGQDISVCSNRPFTSQYLNLTTYNTLIGEEVCLAEGTLGTYKCVSL